MGEIIQNTEIKREKGFLYYTGTDDKGNLTICRAAMVHGKSGSRKKKKKGGKK